MSLIVTNYRNGSIVPELWLPIRDNIYTTRRTNGKFAMRHMCKEFVFADRTEPLEDEEEVGTLCKIAKKDKYRCDFCQKEYSYSANQRKASKLFSKLSRSDIKTICKLGTMGKNLEDFNWKNPNYDPDVTWNDPNKAPISAMFPVIKKIGGGWGLV